MQLERAALGSTIRCHQTGLQLSGDIVGVHINLLRSSVCATSSPVAAGINVCWAARAVTVAASTKDLTQTSAHSPVAQLEVEHQHGRLAIQKLRPYGNGVLLWFELEDYEVAVPAGCGNEC